MAQPQLNQLTGTIPAWFASLPNLEVLKLGANRLVGPIPDSLGRFRKLDRLRLSQNQLPGPVPPSFRNLNLTWAYLSENRLSGEALPLFQGYKSTKEINISRNSSFNFPRASEVSVWVYLQRLDISRNQTYGKIPTAVKNLDPPDLWSFDVSYNRLCRKIPGGNATKNFARTRCLCGEPLKKPCVSNVAAMQPDLASPPTSI